MTFNFGHFDWNSVGAIATALATVVALYLGVAPAARQKKESLRRVKRACRSARREVVRLATRSHNLIRVLSDNDATAEGVADCSRRFVDVSMPAFDYIVSHQDSIDEKHADAIVDAYWAFGRAVYHVRTSASFLPSSNFVRFDVSQLQALLGKLQAAMNALGAIEGSPATDLKAVVTKAEEYAKKEEIREFAKGDPPT